MGLIRMLLALSVVAAHCGAIFGLTLVGGQIAVQSFFIISGFYMSLILNEKYVDTNNSYSLFITNRLIRLFPIYWIILALTVTMAFFAQSSFPTFEPYLSVEQNIFSLLYLIATNLIIFGQDIVLFLGIDSDTGKLFFTENFQNTTPPLYSFLFIPQAWSLGIELTFYLIAPFILRKGLKIVMILICFSFLCRFFIHNILGLQNDPWTYRFFPLEIIFFLGGYISYRIYLKMKNNSIPKYVSLLIIFVMVGFTIFYQYVPSTELEYSPFTHKELLYFFLVVFTVPVSFKFLKNSRTDSLIGELSYPIYVSHLLIAAICSLLPFEILKASWIVSIITIFVAYLLNIIIGIPLEKIRQSRLRRIES